MKLVKLVVIHEWSFFIIWCDARKGFNLIISIIANIGKYNRKQGSDYDLWKKMVGECLRIMESLHQK